MQLQGEKHSIPVRPQPIQNLSPAYAFHSHSPAMSAHLATLGLQPRGGLISVGVRIVQSEGVAALFSGVSATVLRQALYSTSMGLYDVIKHQWADPNTGKMLLTRKVAAGLIAGGIGAAIGNPDDLAMVRMQADGRLPKAQRRGYKSAFDAIARMASQEGIASLWRGSYLTATRAMIVTASQLASYDQFKEMILGKGMMKDDLGTHVTATFAAGFAAAVASKPVDVVKTRVMNMNVEAGATPPYNGALDFAFKTLKAEGPTALYKGFAPTISRLGPFAVVLFVTLEQVRKLLKEF